MTRSKMGPASGRVIERENVDAKKFWRRVQRAAPNDCWIYTGPKNVGGYGQTAIRGSSAPFAAHRVAYALKHGVTPEGQVVMHTCDNPPCVNPRHLRLGTQRENILDARTKGRWVGSQHRLEIGSQCVRGHSITEQTLGKTGADRFCRICRDVYRERRRAFHRNTVRPVQENAIRSMLAGAVPESFASVVARVGERRATMFAHAYGLFGFGLESLTAISSRFRVSRERVRQIVERVEQHLGLGRVVRRRRPLRQLAA